MVYRVGEFELDTRLRQLRRGGRTVHVQPRVFELLGYLVANPDRAISRDELLERIWPGVSVEEGSLTRAVRGVRAALRPDRSLRDAVETIRGFGYRLAAPVDAVAEPAGGATWKEPTRPFVGREAALAQLQRAARTAKEGERRVVSIVGEPGSGKSALARRGLALAGPGFLVGEGQCLQGFGSRTPYLALLEALTNLGREERGRGVVRDAIRRAAPSWMPHLPALFDDAENGLPAVGLQQDQMVREILDALELAARETPVVLFLEDLHWADRSTLALVGALARRSVPARLLILCTVRSTEAQGEALRELRSDLLRAERSLVLETGALAREAVREYATAVLAAASAAGGNLSEQVVEWLWERTEGHPLFLVQLVDQLAALGPADAASGASISRERLDAVGIPATLGQLLGQWASRLEETDRRVLRAASVAGLEFDLRAVQFALGIAYEEAEARCDQLCASGWLQFRDFESWADGSVGARLRFAHAMYAEALYGEIPPGQRGRLHRAIAERLERGHAGASAAPSSEIASHFERAGARKEAARHRVAAAVSAASRQAVDEAIHHAERGLEELRYLPPADRNAAESDLRMSIALALAARHGFANERVEESFARACELAQKIEDRNREVAATWGVSACRQMRGEIESARAVAERLLDLAEAAGEPRYLEYALGLLAIIAYFQGRFADCIAHGEAALDVLRRNPVEAVPPHAIQDTEVTVDIYCGLAHWHLGDPASGREFLDSALRRARALQHPFTEALAEAFTAIFCHLVGDDAARQRKHAARGREVSEAAGISLWRHVSRFMEICADPPTPDRLVQLRATLQEMGRSGGLGGTFFICLLAEFEIAAGTLENARALCAIGFSIAERTTEHNHLPALHLAAARAADDPAERARHLEAAAACAQRLGSAALGARIEAFRSA
jgi:DNA-binding winged helix-turn-helix (wHTH) protein/tetratricopeptide (TPR) repeat protein